VVPLWRCVGVTEEYIIESEHGGRIIRGDCLTEADRLDVETVDLVLTDPPYGTVKGVGMDGWDDETAEWDDAIAPSDLFGVSERLLRKNGKAVFFAQEPFTSELITNAKPNLPFSYRMVWRKDHFANALVAKNAPVKHHEDVLVFTKEYDTNRERPLRKYFEYLFEHIDLTKAGIIERVGQEADHCFRFDSTQFALCTRETYRKLVGEFQIDELDRFKPYGELEAMKKELTFNLPNGQRHKSSVLEYAKPQSDHHPTQKPVALLEDLIRTFTHEGDRVVDLTAGSGSTAVAAYNTGRKCVAIEKNREYFKTAIDRVSQIDDSPVSRCGQYNLTAYTEGET
jgi:site-specific DNA-methyltransferase (adenine-specific)